MKSLTILLLIFLTLFGVEFAANSFNASSNNNHNITFTKNSLSTNIYSFNTSIVGHSSSSAAFRDKRDTNFALDQSEIARQNQITEQILSNYLERRLFPHLSVTQKIPTIAEILPKPKTSTVRPRPRGFASSNFFKKGAGKQQQRKTYGNGYKNRNSLLQRNRQTTTEKPSFEDDYEEVEVEKYVNNKTNHKRENNRDNENVDNDDFIDDAVVETVEDEVATEEEPPELQEPQQQNYQHHLRRQQQLYRHHYRYLEDGNDSEPDGQESLQSVESEQHDNYYSSNDSRGDVFSRDPSENEIDSGEYEVDLNTL